MSETPKTKEHMLRAGIPADKALGVTIQELRNIAKKLGKDHLTAIELWKNPLHEAKLLAVLLDDPKKVTESQMEDWASHFYSWDITDHACNNLFDKTPYAYQKAWEWTSRSEEFVKRAGFTLIATLAVHDKKADDKKFEEFFSVIQKNALDTRNFVKKAINWALRQIGKRNIALNKKCLLIAKEIQKLDSKEAKWIAKDAIRELTNNKILKRLEKKK